ncbi:hypothetical protein D3C73_800460 [compost metagenome]
MPIPPPPAVLFKMTGYPIDDASATASFTLEISGVPGRSGTPALIAISLASCFNPNITICSGVGPINTIPHLLHAAANSAFSLKNP